MWTRAFWKAAGERAAKTAAQTAAAAFGIGTGVLDWDWSGALSVTAGAAILSVLTSIGSAAATDGSPSLSDAEVLAEK